MARLVLSPTTVEYDGDVRGLWVAMREAKKHVRSFMKWGALRAERDALASEARALRYKVQALEDQNAHLKRRVGHLLQQVVRSPNL